MRDHRADECDTVYGQIQVQEDVARLRNQEKVAFAAMKCTISMECRDQFLAWEEAYWKLHVLELKRMYQYGYRDGHNRAMK
jgi:hypothetical protein